MLQPIRNLIEDKDLEDKTSSKRKTLPSEVNFLVLPFFALSRGDAHQRESLRYVKQVRRDGKRQTVVWKVSASPEYGYPGTYDKRVFKAVEELLNRRGYPVDNPITFSIYNLLGLMGRESVGGKDYKEVRESMERLVATTIKSEGTFYHKGEKKYLNEVFHFFSRVIFTGEELPDGEEAEKNYLYLNSWLLDNLNKFYIRPLDYDYYKSLDGALSKRLYELLGVKFYGLLNEDKPFLRYRYENLCKLLPLRRQDYLSKAKEIFAPAHKELRDKNFLQKIDWQGGSPDDTYLTYYPGTKARSEAN